MGCFPKGVSSPPFLRQRWVVPWRRVLITSHRSCYINCFPVLTLPWGSPMPRLRFQWYHPPLRLLLDFCPWVNLRVSAACSSVFSHTLSLCLVVPYMCISSNKCSGDYMYILSGLQAPVVKRDRAFIWGLVLICGCFPVSDIPMTIVWRASSSIFLMN